ncbi:hypothetical protein CP985_03320 [Malaciobacter mytili LMG 24559]|uniref:NACHT domain-containing protein n=1 Tax=Malaciobacter mytili LMG 24559 TaxID=1032238 RepID=A0AAX2AI94_9BACT|nr:NACHT domain-containing protein [Malaciobacter mytili]AXH16388.1 NACHT domain-containing protein [Malaciobacter mytili LMG 24559]RXK16454.1 hypothetical protein CP985_03320 [Malaciobacter mytili LMG 24559]
MSTELRLNDTQKREILRSFKEVDMHKELKILFSKMYNKNGDVYLTHGRDEMGRDLIISLNDPTGIENIAVVVKMDKLSGSASDKTLFEITTQIRQCFEVPLNVKDRLSPLKTNRVYVCIFGEISNKAESNLNANLKEHEGKIKYFDIHMMLKFFTEYYSNIFLGAASIEALHNKYKELSETLLNKNKFIETSFIEPNLRIFNKSKEHLLAISKNSDSAKIGKTIGENLFGEKETINTMATKLLNSQYKILVEGDAGSGKTIFVIKLTMHIIEETIHSINVQNCNEMKSISIPIVLKATDLTNGKNIEKKILEYCYSEEEILLPSLLLIDGMDEVNNKTKEKIISEAEAYCKRKNISLLFTSRKSTEVKKKLHKYQNYELLPFETSQAINYIKKMLSQNQILLNTLIKGIEVLQHQIPLYPMSLSLLIEIAETQKEIPASISELYKRYIDMTLNQYSNGEQINIIFEPTIKMTFLEDISFNLFYKNNVAIIKRNSFENFIDNYIKNFPLITNKEIFIIELERTSLIKIGEEHVEFLHKSFLDYFIASYFKNRQTELYDSDEFKDIYKLYHSSLWEDVTYFYFGQKARITKKEIDLLLSNTPEDFEPLLKDVSQFMIAKLLQFAWHTDSLDKEHAIKVSISNILEMRKGLSKLIEEDLGMQLPKILGDIQMIHFVDEAYSSRFLVDEVKSIIESIDKNKIAENANLFYFSTLYILENMNLLGEEYTKKFLDSFIEYSDCVNPDISLPLVNIVNLFVNKGKLQATDEQSKNLSIITTKMKKKYRDLTIDYLSFKNKMDEMRINKLSNSTKKRKYK